MNKKVVLYVLNRATLTFAGVLCLPLFVSLLYQEPVHVVVSWILSILICLSLWSFSRIRPVNMKFYAREGLVICAALWILFSLIGSLPLYLSGDFPTMIDAFFETASGLTTTGSSVALNVETLHHSVLFWRSLTHLIGGMGVLILVLALLPQASASSVQIAKAEMPGPTFGKLVARLSDTARILYLIYLILTAVLAGFLLAGGMSLFDALCHAFGTAGTGGFGIRADSVASYSPYIQWVLAIGMLVFSVNFNLHYLLMTRKVREFLKDEELHWFLGIVVFCVAMILFNVASLYQSLSTSFRDVFFTVSSVISTTGFTTANYDQWPALAHVMLYLCMFVGGCAGSTAGGLKASRVGIYVKKALSAIRKERDPHQVSPTIFNKKSISDAAMSRLHSYLAMYILLFSIILFVVAWDAPDFETAFSSVACTFNNVGPGFGDVSPINNFAWYSPLSKIALSFGMIAGRLELWPVVVLFTPSTWKKY
ncbi:MAG: TrkH family potassium uptake protein [Peptoniphilaceae bacterium]|nr:TrkH family potassium uptake protein [Peptoniphilaceae bacterium]